MPRAHPLAWPPGTLGWVRHALPETPGSPRGASSLISLTASRLPLLPSPMRASTSPSVGRGRLLLAASLLLFFGLAACSAKSADPAATQPEAKTGSDDKTTPLALPLAKTPADPVVEEPLPPGPPGPFGLQLGQSGPPEISAVAATPGHAAVVHKIDVRDSTRCQRTGLSVCHQWLLAITARQEGASTQQVLVAESDTPSGIVIDALFEVGGDFALLSREGRYTADPNLLHLLLVTADGQATTPQRIAPQLAVTSAAAVSDTPSSAIVCYSGRDDQRQQASFAILCQSFVRRPIEAPLPPSAEGEDAPPPPPPPWQAEVARVVVSGPMPARALSLGWRDGRGVLSWVSGEQRLAVVLDGSAKAMGKLLELGPASPRRGEVTAGHGAFLLTWQDTEGVLQAARVTRHATITGRLSIPDIKHTLSSGVVALPVGFLLGSTPDGHTRLFIVDPEVTTVHSVAGAQGRRLLGGYGTLDLAQAREGRAQWQSAASLIGVKR